MLHLEAVGLVAFVVECLRLVDGELVELIKVIPPLLSAAKLGIQVSVRNVVYNSS